MFQLNHLHHGDGTHPSPDVGAGLQEDHFVVRPSFTAEYLGRGDARYPSPDHDDLLPCGSMRDSGFTVQSSQFRVRGSGFTVRGSRFGVRSSWASSGATW